AEAQVEQLVADIERAVDGPRGPVENRGDALLAGLDLPARILRKRLASHRLVTLDEVMPLLAAKPHRVGSGLRDVRAEHRRQHRLGRRAAAGASEKFLDLAEHHVSVAEVGQWSIESSSSILAPGMCSA